jgi:hypothetical protein
LGCNFIDPTSPCSCNCPEQGSKFKDYLAYDRTYATFWETPLDLPLRRLAQTNQINAQQIKITIPPNENVKIGDIVEVINANDVSEETANEYKKISGRWLVAEIIQMIYGVKSSFFILTLTRNGLHYDPNKSQTPIGVLGGQ